MLVVGKEREAEDVTPADGSVDTNKNRLTTESILISIIYTTFCQSFLTGNRRREDENERLALSCVSIHHPQTQRKTNIGLAVTRRDLVALALSVPAFHLLSLALMFGLARAVAPRSRGEQARGAWGVAHRQGNQPPACIDDSRIPFTTVLILILQCRWPPPSPAPRRR